MKQIALVLFALFALVIPSPQKIPAQVEFPQETLEQTTTTPQDIEVVYSRAPEGVSQELWDWLTEEDARDEAARQSKQIAPRLESYRKTIDELIN